MRSHIAGISFFTSAQILLKGTPFEGWWCVAPKPWNGFALSRPVVEKRGKKLPAGVLPENQRAMRCNFRKFILTAGLCILALIAHRAEGAPLQRARPVRIRSISLNITPYIDVILVRADAPIDRWEAFFKKDPERFVVDLHNSVYFGPLSPARNNGRRIRLVRYGRHKNNVVRIAGDLLKGTKIKPFIAKRGNTLAIYIGRPQTTYIERIMARVKDPHILDVNLIAHKETALLYSAFVLPKPNRVIFDLPDSFPMIGVPHRMKAKGAEDIAIWLEIQSRALRVVIDLGSRPVPSFHINPEPKGVSISLELVNPSAPQASQEAPPKRE